jgi:outer membrane protein assembly complex protein YaeT
MLRRVRCACLATLFLTSIAVLDAEVGQFEGRTVTAIEYDPESRLDPADLAYIQTLKVGSPLHAADVADAVDAFFATGRFADVAVEARPAPNGVVVRFVTKPAYFLGGVNVSGKIAQPPNQGQIVSTAQFTLGAEFRESDMQSALESIKRLMRSNGFYEASITPSLEHDEDAQQVFVTLAVNEGKRAKYEMPVIQGDPKLSDATILRVTGWRLPVIHWWRQVTSSRTRGGLAAVQNKLAGQDRLTARVQLKKMDYDAERRRVRPTVDINAGPKVQIKAVEAKVSKRVLKRYVPVFQEREVYDDLLVEGKRNLQDYFQSQGYYDVTVDYRVRPVENDHEVIEYVISKGSRFKLVNLAITGNHYFKEEAIRERMFIAPTAFNLRHGRYSEAFRRKDEENVKNLYQANGFRDAVITSNVERDYKGKTGDVAVTLTVNEGPQWIVDNLTVEGVELDSAKPLIHRFASGAGQPFAEVNLASDRELLLTHYYTVGFPTATFKAEWRPTATPNHVDVAYTIAEGEHQFVREVVVSGLRTTRQSVIDRVLTIKTGDNLSPVVETEIQKRFYDLGIFARVDTAIQNPDGENENHKYILYNFQEANRYTLNLGIGAQVARFGTPSTTTLSSAAGSTGFSPELSAEIVRLNFLGLGHTISVRGMYSNIEKRASINYLQPRFMNVDSRNISYSLLFDHTLDVRTFASKRQEAAIQVAQKFSKTITGIGRISYRRVSVSDVVIPVLLVPQLLQPVRIGMISANIAQDRRDNSGDPHRGMYNTGDFGVAAKFLGSQRSFFRMLVRNATYYQLRRNLILARQTQFGVIAPFAAPPGIPEDQSVPLPERFFGGGADSLRAFPFNQAGPRDIGAPLVPGGPSSAPTGFPLGGNALFFNNVELRFPLVGANIQGVFFHDMGNIFSTLSDMSFRYKQRDLQDFNYTVHAVGFGIRYRTPVGPIRGDLAYSLNPPSFNGFNGTPQQLLQCNPSVPNPALPYCTPSRQSVGHFQFFFSIGQTF